LRGAYIMIITHNIIHLLKKKIVTHPKDYRSTINEVQVFK
jgi:hypothetical protein